MKHNKIIVAGMLAMVLAFGLVMTGCGSSSTAKPIDLVGTTWVATARGVTTTLKFISDTECTMKDSGHDELPLTYSRNGNKLTIGILKCNISKDGQTISVTGALRFATGTFKKQ
jgi:hypothetical protein